MNLQWCTRTLTLHVCAWGKDYSVLACRTGEKKGDEKPNGAKLKGGRGQALAPKNMHACMHAWMNEALNGGAK